MIFREIAIQKMYAFHEDGLRPNRIKWIKWLLYCLFGGTSTNVQCVHSEYLEASKLCRAALVNFDFA